MDRDLNVLVTGASGFIGRRLVRFLSKQPGLHIFGIDQRSSQIGDIAVDALDLCNRDEISAWRKNRPALDAVFHLAAVVPASFERQSIDNCFSPNLLMVQNVLNIISEDWAAFIYTSSSSVYGQNSVPPFTESSLPRPENPYSLSKYVGEMLGEITHIRSGVSSTAFRLSAPYGPGQKLRTVISIFLKEAHESRDLTLLGSGNRSQDFIYVDDVVQALWLAFLKRVSGVYNIASGQPVTMRELAEIVLSIVPNTKSKIIYAGQEDPQEAYRGIFPIEKAKTELGFVPAVSLIDGLRETIASFASEQE